MSRAVFFTDTAADFSAPLAGSSPVELKRFPDGELYARIPAPVAGRDALVMGRCYPAPDAELFKVLVVVGALKAQGAAEIAAFIPYLPYARMDKSVKEGEAVTADIVCGLLSAAGCAELITVDCHFLKQGEGGFSRAGLKIRNHSAASALLAYFKGKAENPVVTSPDKGAAHMSAKAEGGESMEKARGGYASGGAAYREVESLEAGFDAEGRDVIIIDDMISTGSTMVKAVKVLKAAGAKKVFCAATHGLLLAGSHGKLLEAGAEEVVCTDSIVSPASKVSVTGLAGLMQ
ncbi:MAG: ribose-phosphate diphosphokinase [Candidatus ainarchaeum sp.]|nr:ribose-phosphate diphosphokinase [Candidatus ainarchaeum sp.]